MARKIQLKGGKFDGQVVIHTHHGEAATLYGGSRYKATGQFLGSDEVFEYVDPKPETGSSATPKWAVDPASGLPMAAHMRGGPHDGYQVAVPGVINGANLDGYFPTDERLQSGGSQYQVWQWKWNGQDDVAVRSPVAEVGSSATRVQTFASGAVRGTDANGERYDLLSAEAMAAVTLWAEGQAGGFFPVGVAIARGASVTPVEALQRGLEATGRWVNRIDLRRDGSDTRAAWWLLLAAHLDREGSMDFLGALPPRGVRAYAEAMAEGALKYSENNWRKGFPVSDLLNHAIRHCYLWLDGDATEDHLAHAVWNAMTAVHFTVASQPGDGPVDALGECQFDGVIYDEKAAEDGDPYDEQREKEEPRITKSQAEASWRRKLAAPRHANGEPVGELAQEMKGGVDRLVELEAELVKLRQHEQDVAATTVMRMKEKQDRDRLMGVARQEKLAVELAEAAVARDAKDRAKRDAEGIDSRATWREKWGLDTKEKIDAALRSAREAGREARPDREEKGTVIFQCGDGSCWVHQRDLDKLPPAAKELIEERWTLNVLSLTYHENADLLTDAEKGVPPPPPTSRKPCGAKGPCAHDGPPPTDAEIMEVKAAMGLAAGSSATGKPAPAWWDALPENRKGLRVDGRRFAIGAKAHDNVKIYANAIASGWKADGGYPECRWVEPA